MASKTAILAVKVVSDAKDFTKKMDGASKKVGEFQKTMGQLKGPAMAVLGSLGLIGGGMINLAKDAEQAQGSVNAVFGKWAKDQDKFASDSADRLGLSGKDYDQWSSLVGQSLKDAGVPMNKLAGQTDKLISTAADLGSVFGVDTPEAAEAFMAAMRGEYEQVEKLGIKMNESMVNDRLKAKGLDNLTGSALEEAKAQERSNILMEKGAGYAGNFAKEADTTAGKMQRLTANITDLAVEMGEKLLPYVEKALEAFSGFVTWISENQTLVTYMAVTLGILAAAVLAVNVAMWLIAANPVVLAITAIVVVVALLVAGIIYLINETTFFQDTWAAVTAFITEAITNVTTWFQEAWQAVVDFFTTIVTNIKNWFVTAFTNMMNKSRETINNIKNFFIGLWNKGKEIVTNIRNFFVNGFSYIKGRIQYYINAAKIIIFSIVNRVATTVSNVRTKFNDAWSYVKGRAQYYIGLVKTKIGEIIEKVRTIVSDIKTKFQNAWSYVKGRADYYIGKITGFIDGIGDSVEDAIAWIRDLFNMSGMPGWMSDLFGGGGTGFDVEYFQHAASTFGEGATGGAMGSAITARGSAPSVTNVQINYKIETGVGDPVAIGKEIDSHLKRYQRTVGKR